ncbi:uncharacterized protein LOC134698584 [Mytilus trossulus]|uniref:uncharacterized protein LOC134698584 n=1 Tax=Mytilus trossulus TaxID=6551 RepID=UPI003007C557
MKQFVIEETPSAHLQQNNPTLEITRFLLRKDLLFSRLTSFNDQAESFHTWKASFKNVIDELQVSDSEQIDLLIKWLGPESGKHAMSIRASNANNPTRGLHRLLERLDDRYGAPIMLQTSLVNKLDNFPTLTNKDNSLLYDLSDIISEIEYHKENPKLGCLLAYFDSSRGVNPIVEKLPYGLQEKWITRASRYKSKYEVAFPPFTEFSDFIREISKIKNDPGFIFGSKVTPSTKGAAPRFTPQPGTKINVHKTAVEHGSGETAQQNNLCIIHNTEHSLNECHGFRAKTIEERKDLLRQNNLCYKCCDSTMHRSRDCNVSISGNECGSKQHTTALHTNRVYQPIGAPPRSVDGGEQLELAETKLTSVSSTCTDISKDGSISKSCAKILPVNVFHKNNQDKVIRMYAIIDDQSNRSLVAPEFFSLFNVQTETKDYLLSTCSGSKVTSGKRGNGFVGKSVQHNTRFNLPELIECDNIPNNRNEIATPEDILQYQHLQELQKHILPIDEKCKILLLIGRDLIEAHHVLGQRLGPPKAPFAQKLNLGWIIVGEIRSDKQHIHLELTTKETNPTCSTSVVKPHTKKLPECNKTNTQSNEIQTESFKHYPRLHGQPKTKSATPIASFAEAEKFTSEATPPKVNANKEKYIRKHSIPKESFNSSLNTLGQ